MAQDYAIRFLSSIPGSPLQAHFDDAEPHFPLFRSKYAIVTQGG